jgi:hypothetical protein
MLWLKILFQEIPDGWCFLVDHEVCLIMLYLLFYNEYLFFQILYDIAYFEVIYYKLNVYFFIKFLS